MGDRAGLSLPAPLGGRILNARVNFFDCPAGSPASRSAPARNYTIANPVRSDGFLRIYTVRSPCWRLPGRQRRDDADASSREARHAVAELDKLASPKCFTSAPRSGSVSRR